MPAHLSAQPGGFTHVVTVATPELGDRSYVVHDDEVAVVVDPQRDIDRILAVVDALGLRVTHVLETHLHNDYVTGGLALARALGADYVLPRGDAVSFERHAIGDGDRIVAGTLTITAHHTPGHTPNHTAYVAADAHGPFALFSGGSMLFGAVGRTDLLGKELTEPLTRAQYRSVRRLAEELPPSVSVQPTHGFGSFCAATETSGDASTIARELEQNVALLIDDEDRFVELTVSGLGPYPRYYQHMAPLNAAGPAAPELGMPAPVDPDGLARRVASGRWVVDVRPRGAFARAHLPGTVSIELGDLFSTSFGWVLPWGAPVTLLAEHADQVLRARRQLVRIGVDELEGAAVGPIEALAGGRPSSLRLATFAELARVHDTAVVLDVRRPDEWDEGHLAGALLVPYFELADRVGELPDTELWVHCASGYRAMLGGSLLERAGRRAVVVDDDFAKAAALGLPIARR